MSDVDGGPDSYPYVNTETRALVARMTTKPNATRKGVIDTLIGALKTAGAWSLLDLLYVTAAADLQAASLNWKGDPQFNLQQVGSVTFTADRGVLSDGSTGYFGTTYNPTTADAINYALNSASMGVWVQTAATANNSSEMGVLNARIYSRNVVGTILTRANDGTLTPTAALGATTRLISWSRDNALTYEAYYRGVSVATPVVASTSVSSGNLDICRSTTVYSTSVIGAAFLGGALDATKMLAVSAALDAYATAIGA